MACSGYAVIAVGGGYGMLLEIWLARRFGRAVVSLDSWDLVGHVPVPGSPFEAVKAAFTLAGD